MSAAGGTMRDAGVAMEGAPGRSLSASRRACMLDILRGWRSS